MGSHCVTQVKSLTNVPSFGIQATYEIELCNNEMRYRGLLRPPPSVIQGVVKNTTTIDLNTSLEPPKSNAPWSEWSEWGPKLPKECKIQKKVAYEEEGERVEKWVQQCEKWKDVLRSDWDTSLGALLVDEVQKKVFDPTLGGQESKNAIGKFEYELCEADQQQQWPRRDASEVETLFLLA